MVEHRVVDAANESRDAEYAPEVHTHHVKWRGVLAVVLRQLERKLRHERGLPGVTRAEESDIRLTLQREGHFVGERVHAHDLAEAGVARPDRDDV